MDFVRYLLFWHCLLVLTFSQRLDSPNGILIIGGNSGFALNYKSVEFWSPSDPDEESCSLYDYPRGIKYGPTANLVSSQVVVCYDESCEIFNGGEWSRLTTTRSRRLWHSSAVQDDERILLIGGKYSNSSTEWISVDGSPSQPGPFDVRHGSSHCTIQLSSNVIVLTGGIRTRNLVTRYKMTGNGDETPLTSMNRGRDSHACGVYRDASGQQVLLVTGGADHDDNDLSSTEVAVYSSGSQLEWREVEGGQLPWPRQGLRATLVNAVLYVSGGKDRTYRGAILSWDPATESWQPAGEMCCNRGKEWHAAVAVPASTIAQTKSEEREDPQYFQKLC